LRQRSIVLRQVLKTTELSDEKTTYRAEPGVFLATMMSVTNTTASPGLDVFDPGNYRGPRFNRAGELSAKELVTTFGHGKHSCPAQVFSVSAIRHSVGRLLDRYALVKRFRDPQPLRRQLGGVARADRPCRVEYRLR
jgi:cytochrome P450